MSESRSQTQAARWTTILSSTKRLSKTSSPTSCRLWRAFLVDTKVVERLPENDLASTVQKYLFERTNADNTQYVAELDWNYVVRRSLAILDPPPVKAR